MYYNVILFSLFVIYFIFLQLLLKYETKHLF